MALPLRPSHPFPELLDDDTVGERGGGCRCCYSRISIKFTFLQLVLHTFFAYNVANKLAKQYFLLNMKLGRGPSFIMLREFLHLEAKIKWGTTLKNFSWLPVSAKQHSFVFSKTC